MQLQSGLRRIALTAVVGVATAAGARAFQTAPQPGTGLILGRVVEAGTGRPIAGANVSLGCVGANPSARDRVRTDARGRFVFLYLPPGTHAICAQSSDAIAPPRRVTLAAGQNVSDLVIQMAGAPERGSISGTIVDEHGEAAVAVPVTLLSRNAGGSGPRFWRRGGATTDDRGAFRISPVAAGQYVLMVPSAAVGVPGSTLATLEQLRRENGLTGELQRALASIGAATGNLPPPVPGSAPNEWFDPAFLATLAPAAVRVGVTPGRRTTLDLAIGGR